MPLVFPATVRTGVPSAAQTEAGLYPVGTFSVALFPANSGRFSASLNSVEFTPESESLFSVTSTIMASINTAVGSTSVLAMASVFFAATCGDVCRAT